MAPQRTPRHRAGAPADAPRSRPAAPATAAARRRGDPFARHLRAAPRVAVTSGVAAALLLGPPLGVTLATMTGEVRPEHVGPLGPVVAALPWQGTDPQTWLDGRDPRDDSASRTLADGRATADRDASGDAATPGGAASPSGSSPGDDAGAPEAGGDEAPSPAPSSEAPGAAPGATQGDPVPSDAGTEPAPSVTPAPTSGPAAASAPASAAPASPGTITAEGAAVVDRTNAERAAAGCGPLVVDERLTAAAQLHSEDMLAQGYFDHTSLDGRSPWDRAKTQGYPNPGAENIAKGQATAEDVVRAWMDSPGHRANILNCDLREIGVGHADRVWTQLFGWG